VRLNLYILMALAKLLVHLLYSQKLSKEENYAKVLVILQENLYMPMVNVLPVIHYGHQAQLSEFNTVYHLARITSIGTLLALQLVLVL